MPWLAPTKTKLPDFIICGAMKCGTTTLHAILDKHPKIFIPKKEVHFFDMDNILQHPDFNSFQNKTWTKHAVESNPEKYWQWYSNNFAEAKTGQLVGEDSTTYLASESAAKRIAMQSKSIKIIVMLRDPTARAYSQYWHMVRSGRATHNFEETLQYNPASILNRGLYLNQIESLFKHIPQANVKFLIFEEFLNDKAKSINDIFLFLGLDAELLPAGAIDLHENASRYPKYPNLQVVKNRIFPAMGNNSYQQIFSDNGKNSFLDKLTLSKIIEKGHRIINPLKIKKVDRMNYSTKRILDDFYSRELDGLNELLGRDVLYNWFNDTV